MDKSKILITCVLVSLFALTLIRPVESQESGVGPVRESVIIQGPVENELFMVLVPTQVDWKCRLKNLLSGGRFEITADGISIVRYTTNVEDEGSFIAQPGVRYRFTVTRGSQLSPGTPPSGYAIGSVEYTQEVLYDVRCHGFDIEKGGDNRFHFYLPADYQTNIIPNSPLGNGNSKEINKPKDMKIRNYPIRVWYWFWAGDRHGPVLYSDPEFKISECYSNGKLGTLLVRHGIEDDFRSGYVDIPADKGFKVTLYTGQCDLIAPHRGFNCRYKLTYYLDKTPPDPPSNIRVEDGNVFENKTYTNKGEDSKNPIKLKWTASMDKHTEFRGFKYGPSGTKDYIIGGLGDEKITSTKNECKLTLGEGEYNLQISARDKEDNTSAPSTFNLVVDRTEPTGSIAITGPVDKGKKILNVADKRYTNDKKVMLLLSASDTLSGISHMRLRNENEDWGDWKECEGKNINTNMEWMLSPDDGEKIVYVQYKDRAGNIGDEIIVNGKKEPLSVSIIKDTSAPTVSKFAIEENSDGVLNINGVLYTNNQEVVLDISAVDEGIGVADMQITENPENWPENWEPYSTRKTWTLSEDDGEKTIYIRVKDQFDHISEPAMVSVTLDKSGPDGTVTIKNKNGDTTIKEGEFINTCDILIILDNVEDNLSGLHEYCVSFSNKEEIYTWEKLQDATTKLWTLPDGDGKKTVYIRLQDKLGNITTKVPFIIVDKTRPTGEFTIILPDGSESKGYTNSHDIKLKISNLEDRGNAPSGVKGIYLWNGDSETPPSDTKLIKYEDIPLEEGGYLEWELGEPDPEGKCRVNMLVVDNAGNVSDIDEEDDEKDAIHEVIIFDEKAPPAPDRKDFRHVYQEHEDGKKEISFKWSCNNPDNDLEKFLVVIGNEEIPIAPIIIDGETYVQGSFAVDVTSKYNNNEFNKPVKISVKSVDLAGNVSDPTEYTAYTKAKLGELSGPEQGYDRLEDGSYNHYLSWKLVDSGVATEHLLEIATNNEFTENFCTISIKDNYFIFDKEVFERDLLLHPQDYYYRLVATNNSGDRTEGETLKYTMKNNAPESFNNASLKPVGYAPVDITFTYDEVQDPDDHGLTYQVYWARGENPEEKDFKEVDGDQGDGFTLSCTENDHGELFTWYVEAKDSHDAISRSEKVQFQLDARRPELKMGDLERPFGYTSQEELTFLASDDLSDVASVGFQKTDLDENGNPVSGGGEETTPVQLEPAGDGQYKGVIRLLEGYYDLKIIAWDNAGNDSYVEMKDLRVDQTRPVLGDLQINLPKDEDSGCYLSATNELPLTWAATDKVSGVKGLHYWFLDSEGGILGKTCFISVEDPYSEESYRGILEIPSEVGEKYLVIAVEDRAGNTTDPVSIDLPVLVDTTPPEAELKLSGFSIHGSSYYLSDLSNLEVKFNAKEDHTEVVAAEMRFISSGGEPVSGWEDDWSKLQQTKLTAGHSYRIAGRARNAAGGETEVQSEEFTFDDTAPDKLAIILVASNYPPAPGETVIFKIEVEENDSPITGCRLAVGNSPGGKELTGKISGHHDGWLSVPLNRLNKEETIRSTIPGEIPDGDYYPFIEVKNAAGLTSTLAGQAFTVKESPRLLVDDEGPYTAENDRLRGQWKYTGEEEISYYRYRILGPEDQSITDWEKTFATEATVTGLELENGKQYIFEVQALLAGGEIITGRSLGVVVDTTEPEITTFTTNPYTTSWNLRFFWEGRDDESGIASVQAALGSDYHQTDLTGGWVEVNGNHPVLSCDINGDPLQLETGKRYYLTLRVMNGAGLITERNSSAIVIDDTPPPEPRIFDQGRFINAKEDQPMEAQWYWTEPDPESGTMSFQWIVTTERRLPENVDWRDGNGMTASLTMADLPRREGVTYYFAVKATNGAGLSSIGWSDGIMVDATAPYIRRVKLLQAVGEKEEEVRYITHTRDLTLWIDALDPESGTESYGYNWGFWEELEEKALLYSETPVIELTDFAMPDEEKALVFFRGTCQNPAGLTADGRSAGVMLETGAPIITGVRGILSHDMLLLDWGVDLSQSVSPVDYYEVALVRAEDLNTSPAGWEWEKTVERRYERQIRELLEGGYHLVIRGFNKAGVGSRRELNEWGISELLIIDYTPPEILVINHNSFVSEILNAEVQAEDNLSGIRTYQYALGSFSDHTVYTGGWVDLVSRDKRITLNLVLEPERILHGAELYLAVRACDGAGLWSVAKRSGKILVDHTPPDTPEVTCGSHTNSDRMIEGIGYESEDPESGITHYLLSVVKEEGGEWLTAPEPQPIENFDGTLTGLSLDDGSQYRLVMQVMNGAGLWSDPGYSTPVTVDITPPVLEFNREAEKNGELVFNLDELPKVLTYTLSEDAQVQFTLLAPNGNLKNFSEEGEAGENTVVFGDEGQYIYGTYLLFARPADLAGNLGERAYQQIRINTPPVIHLQEISTPPGKPLPLQQGEGYVSIYDPDDPQNESFHCEWEMGDDSGPKTYDDALKHVYTAPGDYTLRLTVTDDDGGVSVVETTVHVRNTSRGSLYIDETWRGTHHLYGEVVVPEGVALTIESGARIVIEKDPVSRDYDYALIVKGALIIPGGEVIIGLPDGETGLWRGIYIEGQAELSGATVMHARRGLTALESSTVTVTGCVFRGNEVGLHAYGSSPRITECYFLENTVYGIKEDKGEGSVRRPVVINCRFGANRYDYYHQGLAVITLEELNALEGNQGNRRQ